MLFKDPLDIAPQAGRHAAPRWLLLALGLVVAGVVAWHLQRGVNQEPQARPARIETDEKSLASQRARQKIQDVLSGSWSDLFDALESATKKVEGRAAIVSLSPSGSSSGTAEASLTGMAIDTSVMVSFMRSLTADKAIRDVRIVSQQQSEMAGQPVVRFHLAIRWKPGVTGAEARGALENSHLDDLSTLFKLAAEQKVNLGPIGYREDVQPSAGVVIRSLELQVQDDYPKLKSFLAEVLRTMQHAYLEEVRVEVNSSDAKVASALKIGLVYERAAARDLRAVVPAATQRDGSTRLTTQVTHNPFALVFPSKAELGSAKVALANRLPRRKSKPEPQLASPPPPPPVAPPLPFVAVGSITGPQVTKGQPVAFIKQQDQLLVVRAGDTLGPSYRVESVGPREIHFVYIQLMQRQILLLQP